MVIFTRFFTFFLYEFFFSLKEKDEEVHEQSDFLTELQGIHERKKTAQQKLEQFHHQHHRQSVSYAKSTWLDSWPANSVELNINECRFKKPRKKLIKTLNLVPTAAW